jgi:hypothetical protein
VSKLGVPTDLNDELVLTAPFDPHPPATTDTSTDQLARTGIDLKLPLVVGGAAVALALRRRLASFEAQRVDDLDASRSPRR